MVRLKRFFKRFYLAILLFFLYLPILMLMVYSFNGGKTMAKWTGFSLNWYVELFKDPVIMEALGVTLSIALLSSLIAVVIGTLAAIGINEYKKWPKTLTINLTYVPMMNADIVTGISLLLLFIFCLLYTSRNIHLPGALDGRDPLDGEFDIRTRRYQAHPVGLFHQDLQGIHGLVHLAIV